MRLILEPTEPLQTQLEKQFPHFRVVIERPGDDIDADDLADMMRAAMLAQGYHPDTVDEIIEPR